MDRNRFIIRVVVVFLILFIPTFLFGGYYYQQISAEMTADVFAKRATVAGLSASALRNKLNHLVGVAQSLAADPQVLSSAQGGAWSAAVDRIDKLSNDVDYYDPFIDRIVLIDRSGIVRAANPELYGGVGQKSAIYDDWASAIFDKKEPFYVSDVYTRTAIPRINVISVIAPMVAHGAVIGAVSLQIPNNAFSDFGKDVDIGSDGFAYFVDRKGHIVTHPKYSSQGPIIDYSQLDVVQRVMRGESGSEVSYNPLTQVDRALVYTPVPEFGWGIISQESTQNAFGQRDEILSRIVISLLALSLIEIALAFGIALKLFPSSRLGINGNV